MGGTFVTLYLAAVSVMGIFVMAALSCHAIFRVTVNYLHRTKL